jgi:hypothetical protein
LERIISNMSANFSHFRAPFHISSDLRRTMKRAYLASAENLSSLSAGKAAFVRQTLQKLGGLHLKLAGKIVFAYASVLEIDFRRSRRGDESCAMRYPQKTASLIRMKYECAASPNTQQRAKFEGCKMCIARGWRWKTKEQRASRDLCLRTQLG